MKATDKTTSEDELDINSMKLEAIRLVMEIDSEEVLVELLNYLKRLKDEEQ